MAVCTVLSGLLASGALGAAALLVPGPASPRRLGRRPLALGLVSWVLLAGGTLLGVEALAA